ncbi:hypothetical protein [Streptomyces flavofungini]|uniref:hypothetical protein n=1 Tax=Streptomyces flavofungini TaxID=68200 RepID=UPI0025AF25D4|nr:hypothetical protein [Streptomyces flavofungini]WJV51795.1 hypothetical protein QUY26_39920 [Streptomyces flavofungini]
MSSTPQNDVDRALAYPEPPASPLWHRHGAKARPLTLAQQKRNRELLDIAQRKLPTRAA